MKKNKKVEILITGATGFVGSQILRRFVNKNIKTNIIIRKSSNIWRINDIINKTKYHEVDITNRLKIDQIIKKIKPQIVFHLATYGAYPHQKKENKIRKNIIEGILNLLNPCLTNDLKLFVNTGSNSEYGFSRKVMKEKNLLNPNSYYGIYKATSTMICSKLAIEHNLPIITVRPFHVYGPYEEKTRLIPTLITSLLENKNPPLVSPKISRDLIYIDDVVDFYLKLIRSRIPYGNIINLGSGKSFTIEEIFYKVKKLTKSNVIPKWSTMDNRSWDQENWVSNMDKAKKLLKYQTKVSLDNGLKRTINWIKKNNYNI